jgi:hypothetical protein
MHELAAQVPASGKHGGHRIVILVLVIVVAVAVGWVSYALRTRRNRGRS